MLGLIASHMVEQYEHGKGMRMVSVIVISHGMKTKLYTYKWNMQANCNLGHAGLDYIASSWALYKDEDRSINNAMKVKSKLHH